MRRSVAFALFALASPFVLAQTVRADDKNPPPGASPPPAGGEKKAAELKPSGDAASEPTRADRAKKLVTELEIALVAIRAVKPVDPELVKTVEAAIEQARKLSQPITKLADLTPEERKALEDEIRKKMGEEKDGKKEPPGGDPAAGLNEWQQNALAKAFEDVDVSEEEQLEASKVIGAWMKESWAARTAGDSKKVSDLKRDRDDKLEKSLGKKKAQKIINNLNAMAGWGGKR